MENITLSNLAKTELKKARLENKSTPHEDILKKYNFTQHTFS